jgi:hypothetical protein
MEWLGPISTILLSAGMFYSRRLCGISPNLDEHAGYLQVLGNGAPTVSHLKTSQLVIDTPSPRHGFLFGKYVCRKRCSDEVIFEQVHRHGKHGTVGRIYGHSLV